MAIYRSPSFQTEEDKAPKRIKNPDAPSLVNELAKRSTQVAGDIWNAPSVTAGIGTVARTVGKGYSELGPALVGGVDTSIPGNVVTPSQPVVDTGIPKGATEIARGRMDSDYTGPASGFTKMAGDGLTTAVGPQGGSISGVDRPGGSFEVQPGIASDQPGYDQLSNDEKIAANVAKYKQMGDEAQQSNVVSRATQYRALPASQRGRMPDDIADYLGKERTPYGQRAPDGPEGATTPAGAGDFWQSALKDYATGQVGTKGFEAIRKLKSDAEGAQTDVLRERTRLIQQMPAGRDRRRATAALARGVKPVGFPQLPSAGRAASAAGPQTPEGISPQDQFNQLMDVAKFQADEGRATSAADLAQSRETREQATADREAMGSMFELGQTFQQQALQQIPEGIPPEAAPALVQRAWQDAAGDPNAAAQILQGLVQQALQLGGGNPDAEQLRQWLAGARQ